MKKHQSKTANSSAARKRAAVRPSAPLSWRIAACVAAQCSGWCRATSCRSGALSIDQFDAADDPARLPRSPCEAA